MRPRGVQQLSHWSHFLESGHPAWVLPMWENQTPEANKAVLNSLNQKMVCGWDWSDCLEVWTVIYVACHKYGTPMQKQIRLNQVFIYWRQSPTQSNTKRGNRDWVRCYKKTNKVTTEGENKTRGRRTKGEAEATLTETDRVTWTETEYRDDQNTWTKQSWETRE